MATATKTTRRRTKKQAPETAAAAPAAPETPAEATTAAVEQAAATELPEQRTPQGEELARPETATPNPAGPPALMANAPDRLRIWIMTDKEGYLIRPVRRRSENGVGGWMLTKFSDGTQYAVADTPEGLSCDCPGCMAYGPNCSGGKGCKHMRMIRALIATATEG